MKRTNKPKRTTVMDRYLWKCRKCGHMVVSVERPGPIKWSDGHICRFEQEVSSETEKERLKQ